MVIRHIIGEALRGLATLLIFVAERVDPQPPLDSWTGYGSSQDFDFEFYRAPRTWHKTG